MALFFAICSFAAAPEGFTIRSLRGRRETLHTPGPAGYPAGRMSTRACKACEEALDEVGKEARLAA